MNIRNLEERLKALGIGQDEEVSYTLDGYFCTTTMKMYLNLWKQGRNVSMYHLVHGSAEKCCAAYLKAVGEALDEEVANENDQRTTCCPDCGEGEGSG